MIKLRNVAKDSYKDQLKQISKAMHVSKILPHF